MAHRVVFSSRAISDIESIAEYIANDSVAYAQMGRVVPEFAEESIREIFAYSYRIIYKVYADRTVIPAVVHGKRQI